MQYNPIDVEKEVMAFWKERKLYAKAKSQVKGRTPYYFLDGPPYTSGKMHIGLAWNKSLKDALLRYKRMRGFDVWDRAGYDMHGLPTELKVQEKLGIKHKDDIPAYGLSDFIEECKKWSLDNMAIMNQDFERLGVWMDFPNAYRSIENSFIEGEWWLVKKAHENQRLYRGKKTMHWCKKCATSLAKHELEYKQVTDDSLFVKFKASGKDKEYFIIWTTTPWTIPFNLGVMANPDISYVRAKVGDETWILAKNLATIFIQGVAEKQFEILEEFTGDKLEGLGYEHPFADAVDYKAHKERCPKVHTIVMSTEYVDTSSGTGLVHMAPGCGPEDFEVGRRNNILPYNTLNENGMFTEGSFKGLVAKDDDAKFTAALRQRNALIATTPVEHDYAHCWRCKSPVIFRTTEQWFFKVEDLKEQMRELNKSVNWVPDWAGNKWFDSWLDNLRDNGITRQRYWGSPVPIWRCRKCENFEVIGSAAELRKRAGKLPKDFHIPAIDEVTFSCSCGGEMRRIPDVLDVWIDAGTTSWNCLDFPAEKKWFDRLYPPEFILEGKDQIRGWFNMLFVASMVSMNRPAYKAVYMHGFVNDAAGRKMSKSLGNIISPYEVIDKHGADSLRYYAIGGAMPGLDLNYNFDDVKVKQRNLSILWNLHNFLLDEVAPQHGTLGMEERFMLSKLHSTIKKATALMESYHVSEVPLAVEELFLELSRTYIQFTRERDDRESVSWVVGEVLGNVLAMLAPIAPFVTEKMYQDLKGKLDLSEESVHLRQWPIPDDSLIDTKLEEQFDLAKHAIQAILAAREKVNLGVRWPLREAIIEVKDEKVRASLSGMKDILKRQCNLKDVSLVVEYGKSKRSCKVDFAKLGPAFKADAPKVIGKLAMESPDAILKHIEQEGKYVALVDGKEYAILQEHVIVEEALPSGITGVTFRHGTVYLATTLNDELEAEGFSRELMRRVQELRRKNGMVKTDRIRLHLQAPERMLAELEPWKAAISEKVGADTLTVLSTPGSYAFSSLDKIRGREFGIWMEKV
ncbi:MAG: isoleucine--tRNA ligase [Nanoarchaeota archaeon]